MPEEVKISLLHKNGGEVMLAITFPFHPAIVDKVKTLEGRKWDPTNRRWEVPLLNLERIKAMFPTAEFSEGIKQLESIQDQKEEMISEEYNQISKTLDLTKPLPNGLTAFDHQRKGILRMLKYRRQILAFDMGLGKTLTSLVVAKILSEYYNWFVIIIAPASLLERPWNRDAKALKISKQKYSIYSWAKIPEPPSKDFILIADESHMAQAGTKTIRGKSFLTLAESENCKACYPLTGTPIKNGRPINIYPLLKAVRHDLGKDSRYFQLRFCNAHIREFGKKNKRRFWDVTGSSHLEELHEKIKDVMIRRTKKECLDLPEKLRVLREAELSTESIKIYNETLSRLRERYQKRLESGEIKEGGEALVMLGQLAHAGALGKIETAYELASEVVEEGNQVVIFSTYVEPLKTLRDMFEKDNIPTSLLIGETKDREKLVDDSLSGKSRVFLLSMAGGLGIDLYTSTTIILINRPFTPGDVDQVESRLHRYGQKNAVTSIWLQYGEVDEHIDNILYTKSLNISEVVGDKSKESIITFAKKYLKER